MCSASSVCRKRITSLNNPSETTGRKSFPLRYAGRIAKRLISTAHGDRSSRGSVKYSSASSGPAKRGVRRIDPTGCPEWSSSASRNQERVSYASGIGSR